MTPHQDQMARRLCQLLDSAADDLSPRIQSRLATARSQALARLDEITRETSRTGRSRGRFLDFWRTPWQAPAWSRLALTAIPAILLALAAQLERSGGLCPPWSGRPGGGTREVRQGDSSD